MQTSVFSHRIVRGSWGENRIFCCTAVFPLFSLSLSLFYLCLYLSLFISLNVYLYLYIYRFLSLPLSISPSHILTSLSRSHMCVLLFISVSSNCARMMLFVSVWGQFSDPIVDDPMFHVVRAYVIFAERFALLLRSLMSSFWRQHTKSRSIRFVCTSEAPMRWYPI